MATSQALAPKPKAPPARDFAELLKRYRSRSRKSLVDAEQADPDKAQRLRAEALWYANRHNEIAATQQIVEGRRRWRLVVLVPFCVGLGVAADVYLRPLFG